MSRAPHVNVRMEHKRAGQAARLFARRENRVLKFFIGLLTGVVLVVLIVIIGLVAIASMRSRPPEIASGSTLILQLDGDLPERPPVEIPFLEGSKTQLTVADVWSTLRKAAADKRVKAVVIEPMNLQIGWGKMQQLHADLEKFRRSGKPVYAFLKTPGMREYYVATAASKVFMAPEDMLNLKGLRFELPYFKRTLDKVGVTVEIQHAGKFKDFGDMFTRSSMSPETREVLTSVIDRLYGDMVKTIAVGRKKPVAEIQDAIDNGPLLSAQVRGRGLVDDLLYEDQMFGRIKKEIKDDVRKVRGAEYARVSESDAGINAKQKFAFVVAEGTITRGSADSKNSDGIESEDFTQLLAKVGALSSIKGVIVRIDSPGGEVFASDAIWRAMNDLARKKPVVISMSDSAASGGYYMAMNGSPIVAYAGTLTGSIGVVFGKPNLHGLYDKLGVDKDILSRGRFAEIDSDYKSLDPTEQQKLREGIDHEYAVFVKKVADSRKRKFEDIEPKAQGRVWLGDQAKEQGLIDELGGIDQAIEIAKRQAKVPAGDIVSLIVYPPKRSLFDVVLGSANADAAAGSRILAALGLGPSTPITGILHESSIRAWLRGGYMSMSPFSLAFR